MTATNVRFFIQHYLLNVVVTNLLHVTAEGKSVIPRVNLFSPEKYVVVMSYRKSW